MKIVVLGGGTAGYIAAAHISHFFPQEELIHIFDSRIPPIGVGEGTLPAFKAWLKVITNTPFSELTRVCQATPKIGVCFEGWGNTCESFHHYFVGSRQAYHLSASQLPSILKPFIHAKHIDKNVSLLHSSGRHVLIQFSDNTSLEADIVFDATGFPKTISADQIKLNNIPTNAALVWRRQLTTQNNETRAVARPHGWIFVIPLTTSVSYGYIYNNEISNEYDIQMDFKRFLQKEGVMEPPQPRSLTFPSFVHRKFFDGALFRIGNAASFLEPLEATAIAVTLEELRLASLWLADGLFGVEGKDKWHSDTIDLLNNDLIRTVRAVALFVSWHYSHGSIYKTPFWCYAQANFEETLLKYQNDELVDDFLKFTQAAAQVKYSELKKIREPRRYEQKIKPRLSINGELGGFSIPSFAQIGYGIGSYPVSSL